VQKKRSFTGVNKYYYETPPALGGESCLAAKTKKNIKTP